jgi:O-antigen/teichoic acid export membrane protein
MGDDRSLKLINAIRVFLRQFALILRLKEFDTSTPEGRSIERYRRALLTTLAAGVAKGTTVLTMLISVPLALKYLGMERYGLWMTISSVVLMLGFADFGMGLGLMNAISEAHGRDDKQAAATDVSSGFFMLSAITAGILIIFALTYSYIPWPAIFNVKTEPALTEAGPAMAAFSVCFLLNIPLGVIQRVQTGYQDGFINSLWESFGKVLGFICLLVVIYLKGSLVWLVIAVAGAPALASILNGYMLFWVWRPWLQPSWKEATFQSAVKLLRIGLLFFILQICNALVMQSDNIILAQILGPEAVTQYSIPMRLFLIPNMVISIIFATLWPAYGEAIARGDIVWVKKTFKRSLYLVFFIGIPVVGAFLIFSKEIIYYWVGSNIKPTFSLLLGFSLWTIIVLFYGAFGTLFMAANILMFQIICMIITVISKLAVSITLVYIIGLSGIIYGTVIAQGLFLIIPSIYYMPRLFKLIDKK